MKNSVTILLSLVLVMVTVFLFVTAPVPLENISNENNRVPIRKILAIAEAQNDIVRKMYTQEIVAQGQLSGLKFDEYWRDEDVFAAPLPAQFLRITAVSLEKNKVRLGLYLGSDYPINQSNGLSGQQAEYFDILKRTRSPQFFFAQDIERYAYMSEDMATVEACVRCHNDHAQSPKTDWRIDDVMGATTWTYPDEFISMEQSHRVLLALQVAFIDAYRTFLAAAADHPQPPRMVDDWPAQGAAVPSLQAFKSELSRRIAPPTLRALQDIIRDAPISEE